MAGAGSHHHRRRRSGVPFRNSSGMAHPVSAVLRRTSTTFFVDPLGEAAMTAPGQQLWLDAIYATVRNRHEDYYADSTNINLLCLLLVTGNFWQP